MKRTFSLRWLLALVALAGALVATPLAVWRERSRAEPTKASFTSKGLVNTITYRRMPNF
ncbi:MAG: hypothetical protein U0836_14565 [Pirellulales bacterium]